MKLTRIALVTFVIVLVTVVAVGAIAGLLATDDPAHDTVPEHVGLDNPQYDVDRVTSDRTPGEADIRMDSTETDKTVVVDVGPGIDQRSIQPLVNTLVDNGHNVRVNTAPTSGVPGQNRPSISQDSVQQLPPPGSSNDGSVIEGMLQEAHGFISIGTSGYPEDEREAIEEFVEDDGRVVMAVDPAQEFSTEAGHAALYSELGVYTEPGYVYNLRENDLNYQRIYAEPSGTSMLTDGVDRVVLDTATPVRAALSDETLQPIEGSELSVTRDETDKPVLVRLDDVALVGDTDFLAPENTQRADNDVFVGNLADFLVTGDRTVDSVPDDNDDDPGVEMIAVGPDDQPRFDPPVLEIEAGTLVRFEWMSDGHNLVPVTQPDGADWDGVPEIQDEGHVHEHTFEVGGVYEFVSEPHEAEGMFGAIAVEDADSSG